MEQRRLRIALVVAALSGFIALSYEIVWYRVLAIMTGGVAATFGLLLAAYLLGLACGARAAGRFCADDRAGDVLRPLAVFVAVANVVAAAVVPVFGWSARFTDYRLGLVVVALGAGLLGAILPLVAHFAIAPDDRAGARLSYVYLANIVGSSAGSLVTGFVLFDRLSLAGCSTLLALAGFALAGAILALAERPARAGYAAIAAGAALAALAIPRLHDQLYERLVFKGRFDGTQRFAEVVENRSGVIMIGADGTVYGGGAYDGVLNVDLADDDKNGIVRAYLVGALHPAPRRVLMVGLSGGAWAQVVAHVPGVERLTIVEINPGYLDVVARHDEVKGLLANPKVEIVIDDGRRWLLRHPDARFDFVVMNTTLHWRAHATSILSADFMNVVRAHLAPGGVFYFNTTGSLDVALTAAHVFPHALKVSNFVAVADDPFAFDRARWRALLETMTIEGQPVLDLSTARGREAYESLLGWNMIAPRSAILEYYEPLAADVTDDNMRVEWLEPLRYPELR